MNATRSGLYGRANLIVGSEALIAWTEFLLALEAWRSRAGSPFSAATRSLLGPGFRNAVARLLKTGTDRSATGRRLRRNWGRSFVAGFAALMNGVRSSSAARRLTNVVFACLSVGGRSTSVWSSAWFWLAIAPRVVFACVTRFVRSFLRWATALRTLPLATMKRVNVRWSAESSARRRWLASSDGARNL